MLTSIFFSAKVKQTKLNTYRITINIEGVNLVKPSDNFIHVVPNTSKIIAKPK